MDENTAKKLIEEVAAMLEIEPDHRGRVVQDLADLIVRQAGLLALKQLPESERQKLARTFESEDQSKAVEKAQALTSKVDKKLLLQQAAQDIMTPYFEAVTAGINNEQREKIKAVIEKYQAASPTDT